LKNNGERVGFLKTERVEWTIGQKVKILPPFALGP